VTAALKEALVRVRGTSDSVSGTGFLASGHHVVTCAHIVAQALGCTESQAESPSGEVWLDFPHIAPQTPERAVSSAGIPWVCEIATLRRLARITHDNDRDITTIAFRPDWRVLATASLDGTARVWSLRAADLVAEACTRLPRDLEARVQREYLRGDRPGTDLPGPPLNQTRGRGRQTHSCSLLIELTDGADRTD
jgi:hypothetical protein